MLKAGISENKTLNQIAASATSAVVLTTLLYPLDLAHTRMSADMTKKQSIHVQPNQTAPPTRLYTNVFDCLRKSQMQGEGISSRSYRNLYKGYSAALASQVPYTVITLGTFELLETSFEENHTSFTKHDEYPFVIKFMVRLGASTLSIIVAQTLLYPFDTVKRCLQLNGSKGHKTLYKGGLLECMNTLSKTDGLKGLYAGFGLNLVRTVPLTALHLIVFNSFRSLSDPKQNFENPILKSNLDKLKYI